MLTSINVLAAVSRIYSKRSNFHPLVVLISANRMIRLWGILQDAGTYIIEKKGSRMILDGLSDYTTRTIPQSGDDVLFRIGVNSDFGLVRIYS
ncbi:hypothetical protein AVEN_153624-1 [Araneus ventricosus]|uniref:Uncharacterized protein n=1 Tax=Araneus ventricosus TaxID=182803 RepID=A0A4Y2BPJ8_ARAVE|nr:hypothetical protein AVEN_153624-1 [Araneus ventricosus]